MTTAECVESTDNGNTAVEIREMPEKPWVVKAASVMMYVLSGIFVLAVLGGKPSAVLFVPLTVYFGYGLSNLKASARTGAIAFACFGIVVNLGAYIASGFAANATLLDVAFYVPVLALLFSRSARRAIWIRKLSN
jgi:hypothetical protein